MLALILILAGILFVSGLPVFAVFFGAGSLICLLIMKVPLETVGHVFLGGIDSYLLLAVPFYTLMGELAVRIGGARAVVDFCDDLLGHWPGAMAIIVILVSAFFGAVTGTTAAVIAITGLVLAPIMLRIGYGGGYVGALIASSATAGELIPPSLYLLLYGPMVGVSVVRLFAGGMSAGLLSALCIGIVAVFIARRRGYGGHPPVSWKVRRKSFIKSLPMGILPIFILGGIYGGVFTVTEGAVTGCAACLLLNPVYKGLDWRSFFQAVRNTLKLTSMIMFLAASALLFSYTLTFLRIPQALTDLIIGLGLSKMTFMIACLVLWFVLGFPLEALPIMYITVPLLWPVAQTFGVDPIQFGMLLAQSLLIGQLTPPTAIAAYVASGVINVPSIEIIKSIMPFLLAMIVALILLLIFPEISTFLPDLMG